MNIEKARVDLADLNEKREALETELRDMRAKAEEETRDLSDDESKRSDEAFGELDKLDTASEKLAAEIAEEEKRDARLKPALGQGKAVEPIDAQKAAARAKNPASEEKTYRPDNIRSANFWGDMLSAREGDYEARELLTRNRDQAREHYASLSGGDFRDMTTSATAGGDFMPPLYLADLWVHPNMAGRPLADALPKYPLPPEGIAITIPKLSSGISVAARSAGGNVSETDGVTATVSHDVNEYAGLVDIDRIAVMRSDPGLQDVLTRTLVRRYNVALDTDLFSGSGTAPHHTGIDNIGTGLNSVTWTQASPTPALFLSQIYKAISQIDQNRLEERPDMIVMAGRRQAWGAQPNSSTFALFQQSGLFHTSGTQDGGFVETVAGLRVITDNNITTTAGAGTNQDKVYVLVSSDFLLAEGPLYAKVHEGVGSGTGAIRYTVFGHSAFLSKRYPTGAAVISGTGLVSPAFDG